MPPPHMCHLVKFGSSATKGIRINRKEPPKLGSAGTPHPCDGGVADPTCVILIPNLVVLGQTVRALLRKYA